MDRAEIRAFGPHVVLPVQFYPPQAMRPEQRLMLAILEDALSTYRKYAGVSGRRRWRLVTETEQWLFSGDTSWPFSFVNVCHAVGIDVAWLRAQMRPAMPVTPALEKPPLTAAAS